MGNLLDKIKGIFVKEDGGINWTGALLTLGGGLAGAFFTGGFSGEGFAMKHILGILGGAAAGGLGASLLGGGTSANTQQTPPQTTPGAGTQQQPPVQQPTVTPPLQGIQPLVPAGPHHPGPPPRNGNSR